MPTVQDALRHLGIDYADDMVTANVTRALRDAEAHLKGSIGDDVFDLLPDDARVGRLVLAYTDELYDERGTSAKSGNAKRALIHSMEWQLRLALSLAREKAAEGASV